MDSRLECSGNASSVRTLHIRTLESMHSLIDKTSLLEDKIVHLKMELNRKDNMEVVPKQNPKSVQKIGDLEEKLKISTEKIDLLKEDVSDGRRAKEILEEENEVLREELEKSRIENKSLQLFQVEMEQVKEKMSEMKKDIESKNVLVIRMEKEKSELTLELQRLREEVDSEKDVVLCLTKQNQELTVQLDGISKGQNKHKSEVDRLKGVIANYRLQLTNAADASKKSMQLQTYQEELESECKSSVHELAIARKQAKQYEQLYQKLKVDSQKELVALNKDLDRTKVELNNAMAEVSTESHYSARLAEQLEQAKLELLKQVKKKSTGQLNSNFGKFVEMQSQNQKLQDQLYQLSIEKRMDNSKLSKKKNKMPKPPLEQSILPKVPSANQR